MPNYDGPLNEVKPRESWLDDHYKHLSGAVNELERVRNRLYQINERLYGPMPTANDTSPDCEPRKMGMKQELITLDNQFIQLFNEISEALLSLENI